MPAYSQDDKGCEGVGFAKKPPEQYGPEALRSRIGHDPADVDALIHLGILLEEQGQVAQAYDFYTKAIEGRPDCDLGYYFAGLAGEGLSNLATATAEANIRRAISLNPNLRDDPNVQSFLARHQPPKPIAGPKGVQPATTFGEMLAAADRFSVGVAVGLFLGALVFSMAGRRNRNPSG